MILPQKLLGDAREELLKLPEKSFHCCVTSPPYWGLRSYLKKDHPLKSKEIGCEPAFGLYIDHLIEVFDQVRRVLRDDGTLFVNMGDAYGGKNLLMMPTRVAVALQNRGHGWYLRSMIPWIKRNPMPESVEDRPASAVEYVFMFSKSEEYFWDRYAVMMASSDSTHPRKGRDGSFTGNRVVDRTLRGIMEDRQKPKAESMAAGCSQYVVGQRNRRNSDWFMESFEGLLTDESGDPLALMVNIRGSRIQHFATFPPKLVEPFILGGTSERGCCADCGAPWERMIGRRIEVDGRGSGNKERKFRDEHGGNAERQTHQGFGVPYSPEIIQTAGWQPTCQCHGQRIWGKILVQPRISKEEAAEKWGADKNGEYNGKSTKDHASQGPLVQDASDVKARIIKNATEPREVMGWSYQPKIPLEAHPVKPCAVLDPFGGTSTTALVATALGRHSTMCELNPESAEAARQQDSQAALSLL